MKYLLSIRPLLLFFCGASMLFLAASCGDGDDDSLNPPTAAVLLAIDEESIDNGNPPNNFSATDVNDQLAALGLRQTLRYFEDNVGKNIDLFTGEVGDEGWFALKTIPSSWISAGPSALGANNYVVAGPGLGANDDENLLDETPDVTPLRATGLKMLVGKTIIAVVYDSDISINYGLLRGNLKGANLGLVAFDVLEVKKRTDGSSGSLPRVTIRIRDVDEVLLAWQVLFSNAPTMPSSSEPFDVDPPASAPGIILTQAP